MKVENGVNKRTRSDRDKKTNHTSELNNITNYTNPMWIVRQHVARFYADKFVTLNTYEKLLKKEDKVYQLQIKLPMHIILLYAQRWFPNLR